MHYAGTVCYSAAGFCAKNNDDFVKNPDFATMLRGATNTTVANAVTAAAAAAGGGDGGGRSNTKAVSVGRRFVKDVAGLMKDLGETKAHFVRCIKPNRELQPKLFTPSLVLEQLQCAPEPLLTRLTSPCAFSAHCTTGITARRVRRRCSGTVNAVELLASALPTRVPYGALYDRYISHAGEKIQRLRLPPPTFCQALALALEVLDSSATHTMHPHPRAHSVCSVRRSRGTASRVRSVASRLHLGGISAAG